MFAEKIFLEIKKLKTRFVFNAPVKKIEIELKKDMTKKSKKIDLDNIPDEAWPYVGIGICVSAAIFLFNLTKIDNKDIMRS